jgi:hypothetical protein
MWRHLAWLPLPEYFNPVLFLGKKVREKNRNIYIVVSLRVFVLLLLLAKKTQQ